MRALLLWFCLAGCLVAADEVVPEEAVVLTYLEDLRDPERDLGMVLDATAVSPHLGESRREALTTLMASIRADWVRDRFLFQVLEHRTDGGYGAVLVKAWSSVNPVKVDVLSLGIAERKGEWRVAPMMGSFDSVFLGFDEEVEKKVADLERWMSKRRLVLLDRLGSAAVESFRAELSRVRPEVLTDGGAQEVAEGFLEACASGDPLRVLAFLGDPGAQPSNDWFETMNIVNSGLSGKDQQRQWRRMVDPDVIRLVSTVMSNGEEGEFTILFFDPHSARVVENWKVELRRANGLWQIFLPPELLYADRDEDEFAQLTNVGRRWQDRRTRDGFREELETMHPPVTFDTPEEAATELQKVLQTGAFPGMAKILMSGKHLTKIEQRVQLAEAAETWSEIDEGAENRRVELLETIGAENAAVVVYSRIDPGKVGWVEIFGIQLLRGEDGWCIAPGVRVPSDFETITAMQREDQAKVNRSYQGKLSGLNRRAAAPLQDSLIVWGGPGPEAIGEDEARALVTRYRDGLTSENNVGILDFCAVLNGEDGITNGLRNLNYEFRGGRVAPSPARILSTAIAGGWCGVSVFVPAETHSEPSLPLYLVVRTPRGPRILIDADLRLATNKGREVLNERALKRLSDAFGDDELALVRSLFEEHVKIAQTRYDEWEKNNK